MSERGALLPTLDRLFAGPRDSILTVEAFLEGLESRSYAFAIAALNLPNCIPTGIPWLSTVTGVPMFLLVMQYFLGRPVASLPNVVGRRGLPRGQAAGCPGARATAHRTAGECHPPAARLVGDGPAAPLLQLAWMLLIVLLALPIPVRQSAAGLGDPVLLPRPIEGDGVMAMLGWLFTFFTAIWTVFLLMIGHAAIMAAIAAVQHVLFD